MTYERTHAHADSDEHVVVIGDWLHQTTMDKFLLHHHSDGSNKAEGMLINGRGIFTVSECVCSTGRLSGSSKVFTTAVKLQMRASSRTGSSMLLWCCLGNIARKVYTENV